MRVLEIVLYVLAAACLILGLWYGISLMITGPNLASSLGFLGAAGLGGLVNLLNGLLRNLFASIGSALIILGVVLAAVLFAVGRVIHTQLRIEERLARLEAAAR